MDPSLTQYVPKKSLIEGLLEVRYKNLSKNHGAALVELAPLLPILLMLMLGTVDFSNILSTNGTLSTVSREVAFSAFHDCRREGYGTLGTDLSTQACLRDTREQALNNADTMNFANILSGTYVTSDKLQIVLSIYKCNQTCSGDCAAESQTSTSCVCSCSNFTQVAMSPSVEEAGSYLSRYDVALISEQYRSTLDAQGQVLIAEAFYKAEGLTKIRPEYTLYEQSAL